MATIISRKREKYGIGNFVIDVIALPLIIVGWAAGQVIKAITDN